MLTFLLCLSKVCSTLARGKSALLTLRCRFTFGRVTVLRNHLEGESTICLRIGG